MSSLVQLHRGESSSLAGRVKRQCPGWVGSSGPSCRSRLVRLQCWHLCADDFLGCRHDALSSLPIVHGAAGVSGDAVDADRLNGAVVKVSEQLPQAPHLGECNLWWPLLALVLVEHARSQLRCTPRLLRVWTTSLSVADGIVTATVAATEVQNHLFGFLCMENWAVVAPLHQVSLLPPVGLLIVVGYAAHHNGIVCYRLPYYGVGINSGV